MPSSTVGWVIVRGTVSFGVWEFESGRFSFSFFFSKFLSLVSHFRVRLSVRIGFRVRVRVKVRSFEPSSPIVRELVLSLTQLSFPLVQPQRTVSSPTPTPPPSLLIFFVSLPDQLGQDGGGSFIIRPTILDPSYAGYSSSNSGSNSGSNSSSSRVTVTVAVVAAVAAVRKTCVTLSSSRCTLQRQVRLLQLS